MALKKLKQKIGHTEKDSEVELFKLKTFLKINHPDVLDDYEDENKIAGVVYG